MKILLIPLVKGGFDSITEHIKPPFTPPFFESGELQMNFDSMNNKVFRGTGR
jgi:hypothetical protein